MTQQPDLDLVFASLSDPIRRQIVTLLAERQPMTTNELAARFPVTRWAVMKHLAVLRDAGIVQTFPQGRRRLHFISRSGLEAARDWLSGSSLAPGGAPR